MQRDKRGRFKRKYERPPRRGTFDRVLWDAAREIGNHWLKGMTARIKKRADLMEAIKTKLIKIGVARRINEVPPGQAEAK